MTRDAGNNGSSGGLQQRMEQAALLPRHDPVRAKVLAELAEGEVGGAPQTPARLQWLRIVEEADRLKHAIASVPMPSDLETRLLGLSLPPVLPFYRRPIGEIVTRRRLAIAASLIVLVSAGWLAYLGVAAARQARALRQVAMEALNVHTAALQGGSSEGIETADPGAATQWLRTRVKFPAMVLSGGAAHLTGVRVVHLGAATAALTLWEDGGHRYSLLEFVPAEVGLKADFANASADGAAGGAPAAPYKVLLWSQPSYGCGWALVMDPKAPVPFNADGCLP